MSLLVKNNFMKKVPVYKFAKSRKSHDILFNTDNEPKCNVRKRIKRNKTGKLKK